MFSGSNSYLGGASSARPGQPQYGHSQGFAGQLFNAGAQQPQQTGFGQAPLQQQYTGYPGGGLQPQATGFPVQQPQQPPQQSQFQQPAYAGFQQSQPTGYQQPQPPQYQQPQATAFQQAPQQMQSLPQMQSQQTGFPIAQQQNSMPPPPAQPQRPQPTGMTSNDMANSFRSSAAPAIQVSAPKSSSGKIPNIRLSFITASDQAKFEQLFKTATGGDQALSGEKAKDLLMRSKLDGDSLASLWTLADTTKSGQLLFPEFALAMYLCNLKLTGKGLPRALPEKVRNEVSSMVDIISFGIPEDNPQAPPRTNAPNFNESLQIQQPQAQNPSNQSLLSVLTAQPTGFQVPQPASYQVSQPTGFQVSQPTGFQQPTGMSPQQTGFQGGVPQPTNYTGPRPPMPPMPAGFGPQQGLSPQQTGYPGQMAAPLNAQPTGMPGQWGLVNAPASGLPNLQALQQQMMPQPGRESGYSAQGLRGDAKVPWAVTKDEKQIYDAMFKAWDGFGKGFITGNQAIEIFSQSGLDKPELMRIWTLSDPNNKGRLNLDEFAVAMHLIYRRLNGYPVPNQLPPELVPPSTRNLNSSIDAMKGLLSEEAQTRKSTGASLQPQKTGVSYLKSHSFRANGEPMSGFGRKDATVFKNNDDDVGYRSSARRRVGADADGRSPSPSVQSDASADDLSIEQLKKTIREKQVLLDAMDFEDEGAVDQEDVLDRKDRKESEELFRRIRRIQEDIDSHPNSALKPGDSDAERRALQRQLRGLQDRLPELASHVRKCERAIADSHLELFRLKDAKANPSSAQTIVGTGPNGAVTESDRLKARAKAMMQQRSAALSGKKVDTVDDGSAAAARLEAEQKRVTRAREDNESMVRDVEDSVTEYSRGLESGLKEGSESASDEHERRRWEEGLGVEDEVKDFIFDLQRSSRAAKVRNEDNTRPTLNAPTTGERGSDGASQTSAPASRTDSAASSRAPAASTPQTSGSSYSSYKTAEERAAFIRQQAEQRMAERLAALGLKTPAKSGESAAQRAEREQKEREDKLKQAEQEDARRETERQARLQGESLAPPSAAAPASPAGGAAKAKPPPPAPRKNRSESIQSQDQADQKKAEHQNKEQALREQQQAVASETRNLEDEEARQERELKQEREKADAELRALEEQVKAGKLKKSEEKKRREATKREAAQRESRLAAQRAEIEKANEQQRRLRAQLENMDDDDESDEDSEGPQKHTPDESTPTQSMELPARDAPTSVPSASPPPGPPLPSAAPPLPSTAVGIDRRPSESSSAGVASPLGESKNPFFRSMGQTQPQATSPLEAEKKDTNPFHRLTNQDIAKQQQALPDPVPSSARSRTKSADDDDWSVVESTDEDEDDDDGPKGGSAKQLASILFGAMAPPRPLSAMNTGPASTPGSPATASAARVSSPPLPPPMPSSGAPPPPPMPGSGAPPPPPMPFGGAPPPPPGPPPAPSMPGEFPTAPASSPPARGGLLEQIQAGKGLKKVQTKDRSVAPVAGKVL